MHTFKFDKVLTKFKAKLCALFSIETNLYMLYFGLFFLEGHLQDDSLVLCLGFTTGTLNYGNINICWDGVKLGQGRS